jgi:ATP-dependent DNA helicase RecQ
MARAQLEQMIHYAESATCRRSFLLNYFGEVFVPVNEMNCGACDNCLNPRETWDGTVAAQKFLSCVYRIKERSGFGVGINHVVEVLSGADTEKIRKWGHNTLSTYGIGTGHSRAEWAAIARELVRLGYLRQNPDKFQILELTAEGAAVLKKRQKVMLTRSVATVEPAKHRAGEIACDELLFETLRQLRKQLADERSVPPYIIFSDVALRQMARYYPQNGAEFARISGVGEKKLREFGDVFIAEIDQHLQTHPRQIFADDSFAVSRESARPGMTATVCESLNLFRQGRSVEEIATVRQLVPNTIYGHLAAAIEAGEPFSVNQILDPEAQRQIAAAFERHGFANLTGAVESLGGRYLHGQLRVYRALAQRTAKAR